jgi:hypothetical protein
MSATNARLNEELQIMASNKSNSGSQDNAMVEELEAARRESREACAARQELEAKLVLLTAELDETHHKQISDSLLEEVETLKTALVTAEEELSSELGSRQQDQERSGSKMEDLIKDVTQAKAAAQKESEIREKIELETKNQLNSMTEEVQKNKQALDRAKEEAAQNARAVSAARQKLRQLAAGELSNEPVDSTAPLRSSMPMSNPILNSMVRRFIRRLKQQLQVMESSYQEQNYMDLMVIANWVKNESLNLGFEELRSPIASLELCLRRQEFEPIDEIIKQLQNMAERIEISDEPVDDGSSLGVIAQESDDPIPYKRPDSDKKAELLENFVSQLGTKLLEMQTAWQEGNADNLSKICRWILKYGTRLDVPEVIDSAERLDFSLKRNDVDRISQRLWDFIGVYSRIEIVQG